MDPRALPHRILVLFLAGTILLFGFLTHHSRREPGVYLDGGFLRIEETEDGTEYSGRIGKTVVTIVSRHVSETRSEVDYRPSAVGEWRTYGMDYPLAEMDTEHGTRVPGVRITRNGEEIFAGGYGGDPAGTMSWYTPEGIRTAMTPFEAKLEGAKNDRAAEELNRYQIAAFALGPKLSWRGSWIDYGATVCFTLVVMGITMYPGALLPWRHPLFLRNGDLTPAFFTVSFAIDCLLTLVCLWSFMRGLQRIC